MKRLITSFVLAATAWCCGETIFEESFTGNISDWQLSDPATIGLAEQLGGPALILRRDGQAVSPVIPCRVSGQSRYRLEYQTRATGRGDSTGLVRYRIRVLDARSGAVLPGGDAVQDTWIDGIQNKSLNITVPPEITAIQLQWAMTPDSPDGVAIGRIVLRSVDADLPPDVPQLVLDSPGYRGNLYASMPEQIICGRTDAAAARQAVLLDADRKILRTTELTPESRGEFGWNAANLPPGRYLLEVQDQAGMVLTATPLQILAPQSCEALFDVSGKLYVNGKFFFPIVAWCPVYRNDLDIIENTLYHMARHGVNVCAFRMVQIADKLPAILDAAGRNGIKIIVEYNLKPATSEEAEREIATITQQLTPEVLAHPALLGYTLVDEPCWAGASLEPQRIMYRRMRELDPYRPIWLNEAPRNEVALIAPYAEVCDVYGADIYPVPEAYGHSDLPEKGLSSVGQYTRRMRQAGGDGKPVWMTLQGFAWGSLFQKPRQFPTVEELRFMSYDALANGADGIVFWGMETVDRAGFWDDLWRVTEEMQRISGIFALPDVTGRVTADGAGIFCHAYGDDRIGWFILAVNENPEAVTVRFEIADPPPGAIWRRDADIVGRDGEFIDVIPARSGRLYATASLPEPAQPLGTIDEVWERQQSMVQQHAAEADKKYPQK